MAGAGQIRRVLDTLLLLHAMVRSAWQLPWPRVSRGQGDHQGIYYGDGLMTRKRRSEAGAQAESDLKYWGYHVGKQYAADGYSEDNPLLTLLCGHSDLNPLAPRFGVNVKDIPADAWRINALVMRIVAMLRATLIARYCLPPDYETGQLIDPRVLAGVMGISQSEYYRRLGLARERFYSLSAGEPRFLGIAACGESRT